MNDIQTYPIFPLSVFAFPGEEFELHIFEERYKHLVNDVMESHQMFGIPYVLNGEAQDRGCLVRIETVKNQTENGEMDIVVKVVELVNFLTRSSSPSKLYMEGNVELLHFEDTKPGPRLLLLYHRFMLMRDEGKEPEPLVDNNIFELAARLKIPSNQKFSFIDDQLPEHFERNLTNFLTLQIQIESMTQEMGSRFVLN
ncbi:LON peptidase substrate-binding domain-containing protein [Prolixibacter denitrificans]|uniref:Lon N-terminal domain-containing protein n=1 Tax=Prolixibacter denitrificans TaxID=1541063 RepID=A0A2P8CL99_9BACT|nr:LON peptidase substrate-binding domain-containing protein [Prolixibacter denitrificans]PSK85755.1 hypothetical protein CLV93_101726 [Prolixibacter denitrificans]GET20374.1 hypothetical protein JCM18694_06200 [Prolixibacter denitrificans]